MKKRTKDILQGIADGLFPGVVSSIKKTNSGRMEINKTRLIACTLTYGCFVAVLKGWLTLEKALEFIKILFNAE